MGAVPCPPLALLPRHTGEQPQSRASGRGAPSKAAVQLPMSCPCRCGAAHSLLPGRGQAPAPLCWAAALAGLIADQGVLRGLLCRCRSLETLLIPGDPTRPCGQVVITCGAGCASCLGIAPRCLASRGGDNTAGTPPGDSSCHSPDLGHHVCPRDGQSEKNKSPAARADVVVGTTSWGSAWGCAGSVGPGGRRNSLLPKVCHPPRPFWGHLLVPLSLRGHQVASGWHSMLCSLLSHSSAGKRFQLWL